MTLNLVENCIFKNQKIQASLKLKILNKQANLKLWNTNIKIYSQLKNRISQINKSIMKYILLYFKNFSSTQIFIETIKFSVLFSLCYKNNLNNHYKTGLIK